MTQILHRPIIFTFAALWGLFTLAVGPSFSQTQDQPTPVEAIEDRLGSPKNPVQAIDIIEADLHFKHRPVIVFANNPNDPQFLRQMELLTRVSDDFDRRDVMVIVDTDPDAMSPLRKRLRPRGFSLVIMDKDWRSAIRKPLPWEGREIINAIDRMPLARNEAFERSPSGR